MSIVTSISDLINKSVSGNIRNGPFINTKVDLQEVYVDGNMLKIPIFVGVDTDEFEIKSYEIISRDNKNIYAKFSSKGVLNLWWSDDTEIIASLEGVDIYNLSILEIMVIHKL